MPATPCRRCGLPLEGAAIAIGICTPCLYALHDTTLVIPRPRYQPDDGDDSDDSGPYDIHPE